MNIFLSKWKLVIAIFMLLGVVSCTNTPPVTGGEKPPVAGKTEKYIVQLIATTNAAKAAEIKKTFVNEGYSNVMISTITNSGKKIHRVQLGPYANEAAGKAMLMKMKSRYRKNQYVNNAVVKTVYGK